eukprot:s1568_g10.t1
MGNSRMFGSKVFDFRASDLERCRTVGHFCSTLLSRSTASNPMLRIDLAHNSQVMVGCTLLNMLGGGEKSVVGCVILVPCLMAWTMDGNCGGGAPLNGISCLSKQPV